MDQHQTLLVPNTSIVQQQGLPAVGSRMTNQFGMQLRVEGYYHARGLVSLRRDGYDNPTPHPDDLMPIMAPENLSPRLAEFLAEVDRCTSKRLMILDTMPGARPQYAHYDGHSVDAWSDPELIIFFLDIANLNETILAHELAHLWIDRVLGCEDYRIVRNLYNTAQVLQVQYAQSFVLDCKVNEVLHERGFDLSIIKSHLRETLENFAIGAARGKGPRNVNEAVFWALIIGTHLLENESSIQRHGILLNPLDVLQQQLPEAFELGQNFADVVRRHGYSDRAAIRSAIDECLQLAFSFTGEPFDLVTDLEEYQWTENYSDKWPHWLPGFSVPVKVEIGIAMARNRIGTDAQYRLSYNLAGQVQIEFVDVSGRWTMPTVLREMMQIPGQPWVSPSLHVQEPPSYFQPPSNDPSLIPQLPVRPDPMQQVIDYFPDDLKQHMIRQFRRGGGRYYLPGVGRWLSRAGLQEQWMGEHPYTYVSNNPLEAVDPTGLWLWWNPCGWVLIGGVLTWLGFCGSPSTPTPGPAPTPVPPAPTPCPTSGSTPVPTAPPPYDRYTFCKGKTGLALIACKKAVDVACNKGTALCCEADLMGKLAACDQMSVSFPPEPWEETAIANCKKLAQASYSVCMTGAKPG